MKLKNLELIEKVQKAIELTRLEYELAETTLARNNSLLGELITIIEDLTSIVKKDIREN